MKTKLILLLLIFSISINSQNPLYPKVRTVSLDTLKALTSKITVRNAIESTSTVKTTSIIYPSGKIQTDFDTTSTGKLISRKQVNDSLKNLRTTINSISGTSASESFVNSKVLWEDSTVIKQGNDAGLNSTGNYKYMTGTRAGKESDSQFSNHIGFEAGYRDSANYTNFIGYKSGRNNKGQYAAGYGFETLTENTGISVVGIGSYAGGENTADSCIFIGYNQGSHNSVMGKISIDACNTPTPLIDGFCIGDSMIINGTLKTRITGAKNILSLDTAKSPRLIVNSSGTLQLKQNSKNFLECKTLSDGALTSIRNDGSLLFENAATTWDDDNLDPTTLTGGGTAPSSISWASTNIKIASFVNAATDEVQGTREIPHKCKLGSQIYFHCHWSPTTTNTDSIRFGLEYFFTIEGSATTTATTIYIHDKASGTQWAKKTTTFAPITIPNNIGTQFHFRFFRDGTNGRDTYTGDAACSTIGYHYESDGLGSRTITTK